jgi:hypothetical protein
MVVSHLLENIYASNFLFRLFFIAIAIIAIIVVVDTDNAPTIFTMAVYCVLQRTVLSLLVAFDINIPEWVFTIGLVLEMIIVLIVIIMEIPSGPMCLLRGAVFLYEVWLFSTLGTRITYDIIFGIGLLIYASIIIFILILMAYFC